jgi:sigma-B regulation protein RsbU (phosphoserine phosphatase)
LEIAHELQRRLYPREVPDIVGYRLFADGIPALQVGGDYLAVRRLAAGRLDFVIADAMGKGMAAAFFSILTHIAFRCIQDLTPQKSPGEILRTCNRTMEFDLDRFSMFITALYGRLDTHRHTLTYASAGHCPPLITWPDGRTEFLETLDFMLGVNAQTEYRDRAISIEPGTKILLYTDGFTDVVDESGRVLGPEALREAWLQHRNEPLPQACRRLLEDTRQRWAERGLQDDIALIGIERLGSP